MSCEVCFDDDDTVALPKLRLCGHSSCCMACLKRWFSTEETTGQIVPTCPLESCRQEVAAEDVQSILGRSFVAAGSAKKRKRTEDSGATVDPTSKAWLEANTLECGGCEGRLMKSSGCDKLQCICGFRICWKCRTPGAKCSCNPGHGFIDNVTGMPTFSRQGQMAKKDQLQNLKSFLDDKRQERGDPFGLFSGRRNNYREIMDVLRTDPPSFSFASQPSPSFTFPDTGNPFLSAGYPFLSAGYPFLSSGSSLPLPPSPPHFKPLGAASLFGNSHQHRQNTHSIPLEEEDDFQKAIRLSMQLQYRPRVFAGLTGDDNEEDDVQKAVRLSLAGSYSGATSGRIRIPSVRASGKTATSPLCVDDSSDDEDDEVSMKQVAIPLPQQRLPLKGKAKSVGTTALDPVCVDDEEEDLMDTKPAATSTRAPKEAQNLEGGSSGEQTAEG